jgi:hypothetical protein
MSFTLSIYGKITSKPVAVDSAMGCNGGIWLHYSTGQSCSTIHTPIALRHKKEQGGGDGNNKGFIAGHA